MANDTKTDHEWAEHMPTAGENPQHAVEQSTREGVEEKVRSPQSQEAAAAAPAQADPAAAEKNREFVEDSAMRYDDAEKKFAEGDKHRP
ncbi:MAG TPA: hypothetical protein VMW62_06835 [Chloroflexota bacterium]|nr:hypothetical protein [Chloroflexota bacterium]